MFLSLCIYGQRRGFCRSRCFEGASGCFASSGADQKGRPAEVRFSGLAGERQDRGAAVCERARMADIAVTVEGSGAAYVSLVVGEAPEVRDEVDLGELDAVDEIPALAGLVLELDHYGRLVGLRVTGSADSILSASLLAAASPA